MPGCRSSLDSLTTAYTYTVEAFDTSNNHSAQSLPASVTTPPLPGGIQFRGAATGATQNANTVLVVARPPEAVEGDFLLASIDLRDGAVVTPPPGWNLALETRAGTSLAKSTYYRITGPGEPASYVWTFSVPEVASGIILAYSGVDVADPIVASAGQSNARSVYLTAPSVITDVQNTVLVAFYALATNAGISPASSMTERGEVIGSSGRIKITSESADEWFTTTGETGVRIATATKDEVNIGQLFALRPAS